MNKKQELAQELKTLEETAWWQSKEDGMPGLGFLFVIIFGWWLIIPMAVIRKSKIKRLKKKIKALEEAT